MYQIPTNVVYGFRNPYPGKLRLRLLISWLMKKFANSGNDDVMLANDKEALSHSVLLAVLCFPFSYLTKWLFTK